MNRLDRVVSSSLAVDSGIVDIRESLMCGDSKTLVTFEPYIIQTSNLQFWKWQAKSQNMVGTSPHVPIRSGGPVRKSANIGSSYC